MLSLDPKLHFQKAQQPYAEELNKHIRSAWMSSAITHTLAQMSITKATNEQMEGARLFISTFLNISEPVTPPTPALPAKSLSQIK